MKARLNRLKKEFDWIKSKLQIVDSVQTLCMTLGPQRNLTTLTATLIALHPHAQVLNHAGRRILRDARFDFFQNPDQSIYQNFIKFALQISQGGKRGAYGGSIRHAHSFDKQYPVYHKYHNRYGNSAIKDQVKLLFWKDSMRVGKHIRTEVKSLEKLLEKFSQLKFIMPVRFPLDVMRSTREKGYHRLYDTLNSTSTEAETLKAILEEMKWFCQLQQRFPKSFFCFFEHQFGEQTLIDLSDFLHLEVDEQWMKDSLEVFQVRRPYEHSAEIQRYFTAQVEALFADFPIFQSNMFRFLELRSV